MRANRSDFALALEHRQIDQFGVVNAVTLDSAGSSVATIANVPTPQSLWEASARFGAMLNAKNPGLRTRSWKRPIASSSAVR